MANTSPRQIYAGYLLIFIFWAALHYAFYIQLKEFNILRNAEWSELKLDKTDAELKVLQAKTEWILQIYAHQPQKHIASFQCNARLEAICFKIANQYIEIERTVVYVARHQPNQNIASIKLKQIEYYDENQELHFFQDYYVSPDKSNRRQNEEFLLISITLFIVIFLFWNFKFTKNTNQLKSLIIRTTIYSNLLVLFCAIAMTLK